MSTHGIDAAAGSLPKADVPRAGLLGAAQSGLDALNALLATLSGLAVALAGFVLTWEVAGRYFFAIPSDWQDELSVFLLIGATFGAAAWIQARRGHVAIDALSAILPKPVDALRRVLADTLSFLFVAFFAWKSWALFAEAWEEGQTTPSAWGPPLWIPYGCMALGMTLLALQLALQVIGSRHRNTQPAHLAPSPPLTGAPVAGPLPHPATQDHNGLGGRVGERAGDGLNRADRRGSTQ